MPHEIRLAFGSDGRETAIQLTDMPAYVVPTAAPLLRLAATWSRVPFEVSVAGPAVAKIETTVRNPLDHPVTLITGQKKIVLKPGESGTISSEQFVSRSEAATPIDAILDVEGMGRLSQRSGSDRHQSIAGCFLSAVGDVQRVQNRKPRWQGNQKAVPLLTGVERPLPGTINSLSTNTTTYTIAFTVGENRPADAPVGLCC